MTEFELEAMHGARGFVIGDTLLIDIHRPTWRQPWKWFKYHILRRKHDKYTIESMTETTITLKDGLR